MTDSCIWFLMKCCTLHFWCFCQTPVLGLRLGVDFTFDRDNNKNNKNPHIDFFERKSTRGKGIRNKGLGLGARE